MEIAKTEHQIKLVGRLSDGSIAKTHQAGDVVGFSDEDGRFKLWPSSNPLRYNLWTPKGKYELCKHGSLNQYMEILNGTHVRFTHKKIVGMLSYWA